MISSLFRFRGGVKPASHKDESARSPIAPAPLPRELVVPLRQGAANTLPLVVPGQRVLKGQRIGAAEGSFSAAVHAPSSGKVVAIEPRPLPHPSGLDGVCIVIEPDGEERWIERQPVDLRATPPDEVRDVLRDSGILGQGGAVFPSHIKLRARKIRTLVINGAECEPWITCDDRLMRERAAGVVRGATIVRDLLEAEQVLIGVEDNKPEAAAALREAAGSHSVSVVSVPTLYPAGGEKQLIRVLTGVEIPYGKLGPDFGVQCFNVATVYSIHRALDHGEPVITRLVTVTGNVERPRNFEVAIGTPIPDLLALVGVRPDTNRYLMGGPMMGFSLPSLQVPVVKATNCVIAASDALFPPPPPELPCIRCGSCARACPVELQPFELYWFSRSRNFGKCQEYSIFDCIECGCCSYVCPSSIRLVDYFRFAKAEIRAREKEKAAADSARERFEFRTERLEREKREKAEKLAAKTAAAREAAMKKPSPKPAAAQPALVEAEASASASAAFASAAARTPAPAPADPALAEKRRLIEEAIARAKAQKAAVSPRNTDRLTPEQQAEIAEIEARRRHIAQLARTPESPPE